MTPEEEVTYYRDILESGMAAICEAVGVDSERYDRDQADGECYLDCFKDAGKMLKSAGVYWCTEDWEFKIRPPAITIDMTVTPPITIGKH